VGTPRLPPSRDPNRGNRFALLGITVVLVVTVLKGGGLGASGSEGMSPGSILERKARMLYSTCIKVQVHAAPLMDSRITASVERSGGIVEFLQPSWESPTTKRFRIHVLLEKPERLIPVILGVEALQGVAVEDVDPLRSVDRARGALPRIRSSAERLPLSPPKEI